MFFFCPYVRMSKCNQTPAHRLVHDMALTRQNVGYRKYSTLINHPPCSHRLACAYHPSHSLTGLWDRVIPHRACQDSRTSVLLMLLLLWISLSENPYSHKSITCANASFVAGSLLVCCVKHELCQRKESPIFTLMLVYASTSKHIWSICMQMPRFKDKPFFPNNIDTAKNCYNGEFKCKRQHIMFTHLDMHVKTCKRVFQCPYV